MDIEYEATFININKGEIRAKLKKSRRKIDSAGILAKKNCFSFAERM